MKYPDEVEILLVEDKEEDVELTLRALRKNNLANRVHVVSDGQEAIDFIFGKGAYSGRDINHTPRVILLDLKLPRVSGLEVLQRIKSDERTKVIPVVMLTSSKEEQDIVESYRLGVNSYIVKPVSFNDFVKAVTDLGLYWMLLNKPAF